MPEPAAHRRLYCKALGDASSSTCDDWARRRAAAMLDSPGSIRNGFEPRIPTRDQKLSPWRVRVGGPYQIAPSAMPCLAWPRLERRHDHRGETRGRRVDREPRRNQLRGTGLQVERLLEARAQIETRRACRRALAAAGVGPADRADSASRARRGRGAALPTMVVPRCLRRGRSRPKWSPSCRRRAAAARWARADRKSSPRDRDAGCGNWRNVSPPRDAGARTSRAPLVALCDHLRASRRASDRLRAPRRARLRRRPIRPVSASRPAVEPQSRARALSCRRSCRRLLLLELLPRVLRDRPGVSAAETGSVVTAASAARRRR